jgi:hypothetical protein
MTQFTVKRIPLHALKAPIREILAWVIVLASVLAGKCVSAINLSKIRRVQCNRSANANANLASLARVVPLWKIHERSMQDSLAVHNDRVGK